MKLPFTLLIITYYSHGKGDLQKGFSNQLNYHNNLYKSLYYFIVGAINKFYCDMYFYNSIVASRTRKWFHRIILYIRKTCF